MSDNTFKEMLEEYKKVVQIPFEEYKEQTKKDKKELFQFMVHKMANDDIKLFESLEISKEYIELLEEETERLNNIINEFDKWLLGEKMLFYRSSDNERLIRYGETKNKWLELKGSDKE